jgi:hypothetical protein
MFYDGNYLKSFQNNVNGMIEWMLGNLKRLKIMLRKLVHYD